MREVPHGIAVVVERFKERPDKDLIDIDVDIYCERKSHKGMIIGKGGQMLKKIASAARMDIEELLGVKVNLQCWVKVPRGLARQRIAAELAGVRQAVMMLHIVGAGHAPPAAYPL